MPRDQINETKSFWKNDWVWRSKEINQKRLLTFPPTPTDQTQQHICASGGPKWRNPRQPTPHTPMQQLLHHGSRPPWHKLHICWTYEEQDGEQNDQGLPKDYQQDESSRDGTKKTCTWKWMLGSNEGIHQKKWHGLCTCPLGTTQAKPGRTGYSNIQTHFISILAGVNNKFPLSLWCHLLKPTKLTLNFLCQSRWRNTPVGTYILRFSQAGGVYKRYFWASVSSETCAPGGSYCAYSVFLGVTLACLMHSLESLFADLQ